MGHILLGPDLAAGVLSAHLEGREITSFSAGINNKVFGRSRSLEQKAGHQGLYHYRDRRRGHSMVVSFWSLTRPRGKGRFLKGTILPAEGRLLQVKMNETKGHKVSFYERFYASFRSRPYGGKRPELSEVLTPRTVYLSRCFL
jgi:hypothetical protein